MSDFEPIEIEFIINNPEVEAAGQKVIDTLKGIGSAYDDSALQAQKSSVKVLEAVRQAQETLSRGAPTSILLPADFVAQNKKQISEVVDFSKNEFANLIAYAKEANSKGISIVQAKSTDIPTSKTSVSNLDTTAESILGPGFKNTLKQAQQAFAELDQFTQQYILDLVDLQTATAQVEAAQKKLAASFAAGEVDESAFKTSTAELTAAHEQLEAQMNSLATIQETSIALDNMQTNTLNEKKAAVSALKTAYGNLTEAESADTNIGGKMLVQITQLNNAIAGESSTISKGSNILTTYRNLRNKIATDQSNGIFNQEDIAKAKNLENSIKNVNRQLALSSSNTAGIDALKQGVNGLVGGFTAASGVISLFADDNSKAQKILQDSVAVMFAFNGAQQAFQAFNSKSPLAAYIRDLLSQKTALTASTAAQTEATITAEANTVAEVANAEVKTEEAAATEAATVAQWSLNAAMDANPLGIVLVALTAVIAALVYFSNNTDDATKKQTDLNNKLLEAKNLYNDLADATLLPYKNAVTDAENQLALAQAMGKTGAALKAYQDKVIEAKSNLNNYDAGLQGVTGSLAQQKSQVQLLSDTYADYVEKLRAAKNVGADKDQVALLDSQVKNAKANLDAASKIVTERQKNESDAAVQAAQFTKQQQATALQSDAAYWQAKVTVAQKGTADWLSAQKGLNAAQYTNAVSKPGATSGEIDLAQAVKYKADLDANNAYNTQVLQNERDRIAAQLDATAEGSAEELALKLKDLDDYTQQQIIAANNNEAAIQKIKADSLKKQSDLINSSNEADAKKAIAIQQNFAKIQLAILPTDSDSYLAFQKQQNLLAAQNFATSALDAASKSNPAVANLLKRQSLLMDENQAKGFADKIKDIDAALATQLLAIWADKNNKQQQLDNNYINTQMANANKIIDIQADAAKRANNAIIADQAASPLAKSKAQINNNDIDIDAVQQKLQALSSLLIKSYGAAGTAVSQYVVDVEQGFSKLSDINRSDSPIKQALDSIKDPQARTALQGLLTEFEALNASAEQLKQQHLEDIFEQIGEFGNSISSIGNSINDINAALGDTLDTTGQLLQAAGQLAKAIASQDPVAIIAATLNAIGTVFSIGAKARASEKKALADLKNYQDQLIIGQIQYNEYLRQQLLTQQQINDKTADGLNLYLQKLHAAKDAQAVDNDTLLNQIANNGQMITGEHTEKYGGFLGFGKKTKVVQDTQTIDLSQYSSTQDKLNYLTQLEDQGQLTDETKKWVDELKNGSQTWNDITNEIQNAQDQLDQMMTGTTAQSIAQTIESDLQQGIRSVQGFANDVQSIIRNAFISSLTATYLQPAINAFYKQFSAQFDAANGDPTKIDIAGDTNSLNAIINDYLKKQSVADEILKNAGIGLTNATQTATGQIQAQLTEQTGSEFLGITRSNYDEILRQTDILYAQANSLAAIQINTAAAVEQLQNSNDTLLQIQKNTKPVQSRDIGA